MIKNNWYNKLWVYPLVFLIRIFTGNYIEGINNDGELYTMWDLIK